MIPIQIEGVNSNNIPNFITNSEIQIEEIESQDIIEETHADNLKFNRVAVPKPYLSGDESFDENARPKVKRKRNLMQNMPEDHDETMESAYSTPVEMLEDSDEEKTLTPIKVYF